MLKARKGTPQYEEWLRKYKEKRKASTSVSKSTPKKKSASKAKTIYDNEEIGIEELRANPPEFIKDKEEWEDTIDSLQHLLEDPEKSSYSQCIKYYYSRQQYKRAARSVEAFRRGLLRPKRL